MSLNYDLTKIADPSIKIHQAQAGTDDDSEPFEHYLRSIGLRTVQFITETIVE